MALSGYSPSVGISVNEASINYQFMCMRAIDRICNNVGSSVECFVFV